MLLSPIKSVILSGNLNVKNSLKYQLCPSTEFSEGLWNISIASINFSCREQNVKEQCNVSCNLVKAQKFNSKQEVQSYQQPFALLLFQTGVKSIQFDKTWFLINCLSNELKISIQNLNGDDLLIDCDVQILVLFQKIKH
jgi:hypothetical protein